MPTTNAIREYNLPPITPKIAVAGLVFLAATVRFHGLFTNDFHADEALFAVWARLIATWRDPLLSNEIVDKPPLLFYIQAMMYPLMASPAPWVARLPNLAASLLLVPLTARLAWNLYGDMLAAVTAMIVAACSPLLVQFSATAFTDPLLTAVIMASLVAAGSARRGPTASSGERVGLLSGLLLGLALATKYQAALFVPLHVALAFFCKWRGDDWRRWLAGISLPVMALGLWDLARGAGAGLWAQQMYNYGGLRLVWSWELWPRLESWMALWSAFIGSPVLAFTLLLLAPVFFALLIQQQDRPTALDQLLLLFLLGYVVLHWLVAVPVWDRYLLPAAPLAAILLGRFVSRVLAFFGAALPLPAGLKMLIPVTAILAMMLPAGVAAREAQFAIGVRQTKGEGVAQLVRELQDAPYGAVLYDHWYSWQWRYYLLDSRVYLSWFAHRDALVADLNVFLDEDEPRYLALPQAPAAIPVQRRLRDSGYSLAVVRSVPGITLYRITP